MKHPLQRLTILLLLLAAFTSNDLMAQPRFLDPTVSEREQQLRKLAMPYLLNYMPAKDKGKVTDSYLRRNVDLAIRAFVDAPWDTSDIPDSIFLNNILPYSSIGEDADHWRPLFYEDFTPLVQNCTSMTQAAELLNREIWTLIGVTYSPRRDKPDQSPFHSMRIGMASCTGLSIILIDACRAVGIPARFAGCNWTHKPGNHSWVEIWDNGTWHHLGAEDAPLVDQAWFNADVIFADANDPKYAIYATSWKPTGTTFYGTWCENPITSVPAYNVTERYLTLKGSERIPRLSINLTNANQERIVRSVYAVDVKTGEVIARGKTHDNKFDTNNHFNFSMPNGTEVQIFIDEEQPKLIYSYTFGNSDEVLQLQEK